MALIFDCHRPAPPPAPKIGAWVQTHSGIAFDYLAPTPDMVRIEDIAHALANLCRFGGHSGRFYSVAEHSVLVSYCVPPQFALQALMHDATEAYVVDVPRPLKQLLANYAEIEARVWAPIAAKFGLPIELDASVKHADNTVLLAERDALMAEPPIPWLWSTDLPPAEVNIRAFAPERAEIFFLDRFADLGGRA